MKKIINSVAILSLVLASMSFAISAKDTTILGKNYAKITSCSDLGQLRSWTSDGKVVNAVVMQDINCDNKDFKPIGQSESKAYEGIFDGNGKTISGMNLQQTGSGNDNYTGMFGVIGKKAQVKNVIIGNSSINNVTSEYAGILVGLNYGIVTNCQVLSTNTVNAPSATDVGGVAGRNGGYGTMDGCVNYANVTGKTEVGGIAGACTGAISNSVNYGGIKGATAGGITGSMHYRYNSKVDSIWVPGRVALCQNKGSVSGSDYAGGIAGENKDGSINNCRNDGEVSSKDGVAGGVVGYSHFDASSRYTSGKYKTAATVTNSFNTATVSGKVKGGVVGKVGNAIDYSTRTKVDSTCVWRHIIGGGCASYDYKYEYTYDSTFSRIENSYYDNGKLTGVTAVGSSEKSKIKDVSGKPTKDMFKNDAFVALLNRGSSYIAWLFDDNDYPRLNCGADGGDFKVNFIVEGQLYLEGTTKGGVLVETVKDPGKVNGRSFKIWKDDAGDEFTSEQAQTREYKRSLSYYAVFNDLVTITFMADYGGTLVKLDQKAFEKGSQIFYSRMDDDNKPTEIPADFDTDTATYKFTGWDRPFGTANEAETYIAQFEKVMKAFNVTFFVQDEIVDNQKVKIHESAVAPSADKIPVVEGFRFVGWDKDFSDITADLEVDAILEAVAYICKDVDGEVTCDTIPVPGEYTVPETGSNDSLTCVWKDQNGKEYKAGEVISAAEFMKLTLTLVCTVNEFDVRFVAFDTTLVEEQSVAYGEAAEAPAAEKIPTYDGFRFTNWVEDFSRITTALQVNANYIPTVEVCFGAGEFEASDCKPFDKDSTYDMPELPEKQGEDGFTCTEWTLNGESFEGKTFTAAEKMEFVAKCHKNFFDVKFFVLNVPKGETQKVAYGAAATAPEVNEDGYRFRGWDKAFDNVTDNLDVNAIMVELVSVCFDDSCSDLPVDTTINVPDLPNTESTTCSVWKSAESLVNPGQSVEINANMSFEAVCELKKFEVKFVVFEDTLKSDFVEYGSAATAPADSLVAREGFRFDGWDKDFARIVSDLVVNANYIPTVEVCFGAGEFEASDCKPFDKDSTYDMPELPEEQGEDGFTCTEWTLNGESFEGKTFTAAEKMEFVAKCHKNFFDVKFFAFDTLLVDSQKVAYGSAATAPADSLVAREGFRFDGWDKDFARIVSDLVVNAKMTKLYKVCFGDSCPIVDEKDTIEVPDVPDTDSTDCTAWKIGDKIVNPGEKIEVTENMTFEAVCSVKVFDVKFFAFDTLLVDSQKVAYGSAATAPADSLVAREGFRFDGWDKDFARIVSDLVVNAKMTKLYEVCFGDSCTIVDEKDTIEVPDVPDTDSTDCSAWIVDGKIVNPGEKIEVTENMTFEAVCSDKVFDVKFFAFDTLLVDSQRVAYGFAAVAPDSLAPEFEGYRFRDWDADFTYITSDLVVNAMYDTLVEINIHIADLDVDTTIVVLKDTVITGLDSVKKVFEATVGEGIQCKVSIDGEELASDSLAISKDIDVDVKCNLLVKEVTFYVADSILGTVKVLYGFAADFDAPVFPNKRFVGWDIDLNRVIDDVDAHAKYVDVDTVFVMVNGAAIDSVEIAKGDSVEYVLRTVDNTEDSTFLAWNVDGESHNAKDVVFLKYGSEVFADFEKTNAIRGKRLAAGFAIHSENSQLMISGARVGDLMTVLDLQGRVIAQKRVQNSVEIVNIANRGNYLVRVGYQTKRVVVR